MVLHALELCAGYAGMSLAFRLAGLDVRTVAYVERDAYAAATLIAHMENQTLDPAPCWSDITTFDGVPWRGRVDLITAGFPCPDFSAAGRRAGVHGDHWLWPDVARVIGEVEPRYVFLENVPGLVRLGGLTRVLSDLAEFGFDAEWGLLSAAAVGAPHERQRFWLLAHADRVELGAACTERPERLLVDVARCGDAVGHTSRTRRSEITRSPHVDEGTDGREPHPTNVADGPNEDVGDPAESRRTFSGHSGARTAQPWQPDIGRSMVWPPLPTDIDGWTHWVAAGGPEPQVRRGSDGRAVGLASALHLGGNGCVPAVAAEALAQLATRAGWGCRVTDATHNTREEPTDGDRTSPPGTTTP